MSFQFSRILNDRPLLLVSVRNSSEAIDALEGGADVIDVKEPSRGSLGAADRLEVERVAHCVRDRLPVTIAGGELLDASLDGTSFSLPSGVGWIKFGLSRCGKDQDWRAKFAQLQRLLDSTGHLVPVAYADWIAADSPDPESILKLARSCKSPVVLVDTFDKRSGALFNYWHFTEVKEFVVRAHEIGTAVAVAGGFRLEDVSVAVATGADVIGVRGAVCDGGRSGRLQRQLVELASHSMERCRYTPSLQRVLQN